MDQMNSAPNATPVPPMPQKSEGGAGAMFAIVVIVVLLALGGVYYLMTGGMLATEDGAATGLENSQDPDVQAALSQSASDDLSDIEADVNATDFGSLDAAVSDVE